MNLTLTSLCCVDQPFFLEIQYVDHSAEGDTLPSLLMDNIDPPPDTCDNWIFWYGDYYEWYDVWSPPVPGDAIIRAAGYTESEDCAPLVCPEDSNDRGLCDTMYVEPWPPDTILEGTGPHSVRVPIFVTNDVVDTWDSICGFTIPLCYSHSNPAAYCSVSYYWNTLETIPLHPFFPRSVFYHLSEGMDTVYNRMALLEADWSLRAWDFRILELDGTGHFWFRILPDGVRDQLWWDANKVLLATMTFRVEDTMQVCIDTCFWPPANHLAWDVMTEDGSNVISKVPRMGSPHDAASYRTCFNVAPFVNNAPEPFSLLFPPNKAFAPRKVRFIWETTTDPDSADQIRYDLYVSTSRHFHPDSTTVDSNLVFSQHSKKFDLGFYYWKVRAKDDLGAERWSNETLCFVVTGLPHQIVGDFNSDERVDLADVVFAINYLYRSGPPPEPLEVGDCNCDGAIDLGDVVHLLNYLFKSGMAPGC